MREEEKKDFLDTVDKIAQKFRSNARDLRHGKLKFSGVCEVVFGDVKQCDIEFEPIERLRADSKA